MQILKTLTFRSQILLLVVLIISVICSAGYSISFHQARLYHEQQIAIKNSDDAASLAAVIAAGADDMVDIELMMDGKFNTGHFSEIRLHGPDGKLLISREGIPVDVTVPAWFVNFVDIDNAPGQASVSIGWEEIGRLTVVSEDLYAVDMLWRSAKSLMLLFVLVAVVACYIASRLLWSILYPLKVAIAQAEDISNNRFQTNEIEVKNREGKLLIGAMNNLSINMKLMLGRQQEAVAKLTDELHRDKLTGAFNRDYFMNALRSNGAAESGALNALVLFRYADLGALSKKYGRNEVDRFIRDTLDTVDAVLLRTDDCYSRRMVGRLNGSDFAIHLTEVLAVESIAKPLFDALMALATKKFSQENSVIRLAGVSIARGESVSETMTRVDNLLAQAEFGDAPYQISEGQGEAPICKTSEEWYAFISEAVSNQHLALETEPVLDADGAEIQREASLRIGRGDTTYPAYQIVPWARRLGLMPELNMALLRQVPNYFRDHRFYGDIAIEVSHELLASANKSLQFFDCLADFPLAVKQRICLDIGESLILDDLRLSEAFVADAKAQKVKVGIQGVTGLIANLRGIETLGFHYFKVDTQAMFYADDAAQRELIFNLLTIADTLNIRVIAANIDSSDRYSQVKALGFGGFCGPVLKN